MKMQNEIRAPRDGVIGQVAVSANQPVAAGVLLVRLD
jgi:biotin carboxyl carrier protein